MKRIDNNKIDIVENDIIVFGNIRDEELRLPYFLEFHRKIGVSAFVIVDNDSSDGSREFLLDQTDVITYFTDQPYAESRYGIDWVNALLDRYGTGQWTLTLDADELFVFPKMEQVSLRKFCNYLEQEQKNALQTIMIDMYSDKPIKDTRLNPGDRFLDVCPFFDQNLSLGDNRGSTRRRLFWDDKQIDVDAKPPVVKKMPLVKWEQGFKFLASTHTINDVSMAVETGALLHFKFIHNLLQYAEDTVREKNHWDNSAQYRMYDSGLKESPDLSPFFEQSVRYSDSHQLIDLGLIRTTTDFIKYIQNSI